MSPTTPAIAVVRTVIDIIGSSEPETDWIRRNLTLFPLPRVEFVEPLFAALQRIAGNVRWLPGTLGYDINMYTSAVCRQLKAAGYGGGSTAGVVLGGDYALAGTLIGTEFTPQPGPEALRAALWICHERWTLAGTTCSTLVNAFASAIRGSLKPRHGVPLDEQPLAQYYGTIAQTRTLDEFLAAADPLRQSAQRAIRNVWPLIADELGQAPTLSPKPSTVPSSQSVPSQHSRTALRPQTPPPRSARRRDPKDLGPPIRLRRVAALPQRMMQRLEEGEPTAELAIPTTLAPIGVAAHAPRAAREIARYQVIQAVWGQNNLLLTTHHDVLREALLKRVMQMLLELLAQAQPATPAVGLASLLMQAITGRTTRALLGLRQVVSFTPQIAAPIEWCHPQRTFRIGSFITAPSTAASRHSANSLVRGYFQPSDVQRPLLEPTVEAFHLSVPVPIADALAHGLPPDCFAALAPDTLDSQLREAARAVSAAVGFDVYAGQIRRSFAAYLFDTCRDMALVQLVCADTLGQSEAPLHYYAPRERDVAEAYEATLNRLLMQASFDEFRRLGEQRVGSQLLVKTKVARRMVATLSRRFPRHKAPGSPATSAAQIHAALVLQLGCMFWSVAGHRPVDALFKLTLADIDLETGAALFRDKVYDPAHNPRLAALPDCLVRQIRIYLGHLQGLASTLPQLELDVSRVLAGDAALLFGLDEADRIWPLDQAAFSALLPPEWHVLPKNWGRTWIRTRGAEAGIAPELLSMQLGHLEAVGFPFSGASPTTAPDFLTAIRPGLERLAKAQGWRVHAGGVPTTPVTLDSSPLHRWGSIIFQHERDIRRVAADWRTAEKAQMCSYRLAAEAHVLKRPEIHDAGIDRIYNDPQGPWLPHDLTLDAANALCTTLAEESGPDLALALARISALRRILKCVNRRAGIKDGVPNSWMPYRRAIDNAFIPGMMTAVRQVRALREAALANAPKKGIVGHHFAQACARTAYVLAVFGHCEAPEQIEGILRHRREFVRSHRFDDLILVPCGREPSEVVALRGLAAISVARLAKKYRANETASYADISNALQSLLPSWAIPAKSAGSGDLLRLLCETVAVSNRFELPPGARLARDPREGSVSAPLMEQIALLDGDPVGTVQHAGEQRAPIDGSSRVFDYSGPRQGNARSQYRALCRILPRSGCDLSLPLTGVDIRAADLFRPGTRTCVIAEIRVRLAAQEPENTLQPIVRLLATWVLEMLETGTLKKTSPADNTIRTYLTRIGGHLVTLVAQDSMKDIGDEELEGDYLAAVEASGNKRDQAAAAILSFHDCCMRRFDFPELDLSEIRRYLTTSVRTVDAELILPQERAAAAAALDHWSTAGLPSVPGRAGLRRARQAAAAYPLYALGGARRSEILGLRFGDVGTVSDNHYLIEIRPNASRRLKTRAAHRTIALSAGLSAASAAHFSSWLTAEHGRLPKWRSENAFVFAPLADARRTTGREDIAQTCRSALAMATGRPSDRLHRLRHLVTFEIVTPIFLAPSDRTTLPGLLQPTTLGPAGIPLPRDLAMVTTTLGHSRPTTTLGCYHHLPWLLCSRADAALRVRYLNRRGVAYAMGVTLGDVSDITRRKTGLTQEQAWMARVARPRIVPITIDTALSTAAATCTHAPWTAVQLGVLLAAVEKTGDIALALTAVGGTADDASRIQRVLAPYEKRMGRRILAGGRDRSQILPRKLARDLKAAAGLETWWARFDTDSEDRAQLAQISNDVFIRMSPEHGYAVHVAGELADALRELIAQALPDTLIHTEDGALGITAIVVTRAGGSRMSGDSSDPAARYMGIAIKRALGVIWATRQLSTMR